MKLKKDIVLTPNFSFNEFLYSKDIQLPSIEQSFNLQQLAIKLQQLRNVVGSVTINSGFRGIEHNKSVGGYSKSYHLDGTAADIKFDFRDWNRENLTKLLKSIGFTNVNFYWNTKRTSFVWLHVDIGKTWNGEEFYYRDLDSVSQKEIKP